jgi:hypothetical protein
MSSIATVFVVAGIALALLLGALVVCDVLTYRKGRGAMLVSGLLMLLLSVVEFQRGSRAAATHIIVPGNWNRGPLTAEQEYALSALLIFFASACIVLSLQRIRRDSK